MKRRLKSMAVLFLCAIIFLGSLSGAKTALAAGEYTAYIVENPTGLIDDIYILKPDGSKEIVYCYNREYSWPDYEGVSGYTKVPYSGVSHEKPSHKNGSKSRVSNKFR